MSATPPAPLAAPRRLRLTVSGAVQGVGFRPFVFRLANELGLAGWVKNSPRGVVLEIQGAHRELKRFQERLHREPPPHSFIRECQADWLPIGEARGFAICPSEGQGSKRAVLLPDLATCPECVREIFDPANRRHRYPFTNCTHCGPRFSIIEALPYDRANTSMRGFDMCAACQAEYENPSDRRFHAQPNACPVCGPQLELWSATGEAIFGGDTALRAAAQHIRRGKIVAVKNVGGFHLLVDARNETAVRRLRERKHREEKPFALLFPSLANLKTVCRVSASEERLLLSAAAPIVLLEQIRNAKSPIAAAVAPANPYLGVMLPANPLQHLLLAELGFPIVATSGNVSDEPMCTEEREALARLRGVADFFLVHNRPIVRPLDDSIARIMLGRESLLRRARGYSPLPLALPGKNNGQENNSRRRKNVLAVGAHLKNAVALAVDDHFFVSQHLGDLATEPANHAFRQAAADLPRLYAATPEVIVADLHPDYGSTRFALAAGVPQVVRVQHHVAHVLACVAENQLSLPALGVAWDGTGLGSDGTIWGGEFFGVTESGVERLAHLRPFRLPGGDAAAREPLRAAAGLLYEIFGAECFNQSEADAFRKWSVPQRMNLQTLLARGVNAPWCSSVGRLFDAVAALTGVRARAGFEGQAAMALEFAAHGLETDASYPFPFIVGEPLVLDWEPLVREILRDRARGVSVAEISAKFHNSLAEAVVGVARQVGEQRVALSGGCFQNRRLTERAVQRLRAEGFAPHWHHQVPTNDGGIALGQLVAASRPLTEIKNPKSRIPN